MKIQPTEQEEMFANDATKKGLISETYKQLIWLNKKKKKPNQKMGRRLRQTFLQRHSDGQQAHENMLNITNYQKHANQNHNQVSSQTSQNGHHQKVYK